MAMNGDGGARRGGRCARRASRGTRSRPADGHLHVHEHERRNGPPAEAAKASSASRPVGGRLDARAPPMAMQLLGYLVVQGVVLGHEDTPPRQRRRFRRRGSGGAPGRRIARRRKAGRLKERDGGRDVFGKRRDGGRACWLCRGGVRRRGSACGAFRGRAVSHRRGGWRVAFGRRGRSDLVRAHAERRRPPRTSSRGPRRWPRGCAPPMSSTKRLRDGQAQPGARRAGGPPEASLLLERGEDRAPGARAGCRSPCRKRPGAASSRSSASAGFPSSPAPAGGAALLTASDRLPALGPSELERVAHEVVDDLAEPQRDRPTTWLGPPSPATHGVGKATPRSRRLRARTRRVLRPDERAPGRTARWLAPACRSRPCSCRGRR